MAQLLTLDNLLPNPSWYLSDAKYSWESRKWIYQWPSALYPYSSAIHKDDFLITPDLKIKIRKWIEQNCKTSVITSELDKSYRVYYGPDRTWDQSYNRENTWVQFYFDNEEDLLLFKLAFSEYVKPVTDLHPTAGNEYEKTSYYKSY